MIGAPRAWATSTVASSRASFSRLLSVGDSPVVPHTTRPSVPESSRAAARRLAWSRSSDPFDALNGVTIAVSKRPGLRVVMRAPPGLVALEWPVIASRCEPRARIPGWHSERRPFSDYHPLPRAPGHADARDPRARGRRRPGPGL